MSTTNKRGSSSGSQSFVIKRTQTEIAELDDGTSSMTGLGTSKAGLGRLGAAAAARSFVRKKPAVETLGSKYPDSERGEARLRASFLEEYRETTAPTGPAIATLGRGVKAAPAVADEAASPTGKEKAFFKTPRYNLGSSAVDAEKVARELEEKKAAHSAGGEGEKKQSGFFKTVFSKHRNRR